MSDASDRYVAGSGNVFADLGLPEPELRLAKAKLAREITAIIRDRRLTQQQVADLLGIGQPKVSAIVRGRLSGFSSEKLIEFLTKLGQDVDISITPAEEPRSTGRVTIHGGSTAEPMVAAPPERNGGVRFS